VVGVHHHPRLIGNDCRCRQQGPRRHCLLRTLCELRCFDRHVGAWVVLSWTAARFSIILARVTVQVRRCSDADLAVLLMRWPIAGGVHESHIAEGDYLVAWDRDEPLGSGVLRWAGMVGDNARAAAGGAPALIHLHVRDTHRGRGVGTVLVQAAEQAVGRRGGTALAHGVGVDNPDAARLHDRLGYQRTGVLDTVEYIWIDADGGQHHERETSELRLRSLDVTSVELA